jgi:hypothetical protein
MAPRVREDRGWVIGLLLAIAVFGLYGVTTGNLVGYEDETAAVTEGLVNAGQLRVLPGTPLSDQGLPGRGGYRYSRTGLTQPLLEAPFYYVGNKLDEATSDGQVYRWRDTLLRLYNPAMAALTVLAIFALLRLRGVSERRAVGTALLCAVATLIWPYSKIGLDTTLMAMVALAILAAAWVAERPSTVRFALAGMAAGAAAAGKPYGALLALGLAPILFGPFIGLSRTDRAKALVAFAIPVFAWLVAIGWYNWYRTGSVTNFNNTYVSELLATPAVFLSS